MNDFLAILKNEWIKIIKKPRSFIGFVVVAFICSMLELAFYHDGREILGFFTGQLENTFDIQGNVLNGNLICFILLQTLIIQMPLLVALVTGDLISGELGSGTVRFLLTRPASRTKIVIAKWMVGIAYTTLLLIWLGIFALFISRLIFGQGDLIHLSSTGVQIIKSNDMNWRFAMAFLVAMLALGVVASLSLFLSSFMENSITPIVMTMAIIIIFTIIGMFDFPSFDILRPFLFTTHMISWKEFFEHPVPWHSVNQSMIILLLHIFLFLGASIYIFNRKDITQ